MAPAAVGAKHFASAAGEAHDGAHFDGVHEPDYQYLIQRMREARLDAGLTQVEVAAALDRPMSFVSKCELGERRLDPIDLRDFAELYGKPLEYFYPARRRRIRKPSP